MTDAEAREMRLLKQENAQLTQLVTWYRAREHQQYLDGANPEWVGQVHDRQAARQAA